MTTEKTGNTKEEVAIPSFAASVAVKNGRGRPAKDTIPEGEKTPEQIAEEARLKAELDEKLKVKLEKSDDFDTIFSTKIANIFFEAIDKNSPIFESLFNKPWNEMTYAQKTQAKSYLRDGYMSMIYEPLMKTKYQK